MEHNKVVYCDECDGHMTLEEKESWAWSEWNGLDIFTPERGIHAWVCNDCDEFMLTSSSRRMLKEHVELEKKRLSAEFVKSRIDSIRALASKAKITDKLIAQEMRIHNTYLSRLKSGGEVAGERTILLLDIFSGNYCGQLLEHIQRMYPRQPFWHSDLQDFDLEAANDDCRSENIERVFASFDGGAPKQQSERVLLERVA